MTKVKPTKHLLSDRMNRVQYIGTTIGFGEVVFTNTTLKHDKSNKAITVKVTDTGVFLVYGENDELITMYIPSEIKTICAVFKGNIPTWFKKIYKRNIKLNHHILQNL